MTVPPEEIFLPFSLKEIAQLPVGELSLGVPLHQDVIQVGNFRKCDIGRIILTTDERHATTISRQDGAPLQASIITPHRDFVSTVEPTLDVPVFGSPVDQLRLTPKKLPDHGIIWFASGNGLQIPNFNNLDWLCRTIGSYAVQKLEKINGPSY